MAVFFFPGATEATLTAHRVAVIYAVASPPNDGVNHWRLFFSDGTSANVIFDMTPGSDGTTGVLAIKTEPHPISDVVAQVQLTPQATRSAWDYLHLITTSGRDKYRFAASGEGCRAWIRGLVSDMENGALLPAGSSQLLDTQILYVQPSGQPSTPAQGAYYQ